MDDNPILLVEDDSNDVELTLMALRKNKINSRVIVVRDGLEALEYLLAQGRHSDLGSRDLPALVLLDLKLPYVSGLEVLKWIKADETTKVVPVVVLTSSTEQKDIRCCYEYGANGYVRKPASFDDFVTLVKRLHEYWFVVNLPPPTNN